MNERKTIESKDVKALPFRTSPRSHPTENIMHADDLFTAPQVAKICSTDLKTIHNWVNRGEIKSFRTPGRHLRFRRQDILDFLARYGYPVPDGFAPNKQRVIVVDSEDGTLRGLKRALARDFEVEAYGDHIDALLAIGKERPSLVAINIDGGAEALHMVEKLAADKDSLVVLAYAGGPALEEKALGAGAGEFVPVTDGKEVRRRIMALLGK
ncbi:MAG: helix-turn-helix domain-containing protein [Deltaproteobacteria bacterium]|nr:helix-turn-helix domain-containing protein [Deltaproteobacteria bacterium]